MVTIKIKNPQIVRSTPKAVLLAFPEGSEFSNFAVWFPKSKVEQQGKDATIELVGNEFQLVLKGNNILDREKLAKAFGTEITISDDLAKNK